MVQGPRLSRPWLINCRNKLFHKQIITLIFKEDKIRYRQEDVLLALKFNTLFCNRPRKWNWSNRIFIRYISTDLPELKNFLLIMKGIGKKSVRQTLHIILEICFVFGKWFRECSFCCGQICLSENIERSNLGGTLWKHWKWEFVTYTELRTIFKHLRPNNDHHNKRTSGSYEMRSQSVFSGQRSSLGPLLLTLLVPLRWEIMLHCPWAEVERLRSPVSWVGTRCRHLALQPLLLT